MPVTITIPEDALHLLPFLCRVLGIAQPNTAAPAWAKALQSTMTERLDTMSLNLSRLAADVASIKGVVPSAVAALTALKDQIAELQATIASGDTEASQAAVDALAADLEAAVQPLAQAIAANATPAPGGAPASPDAPASGDAPASPNA